MLQSERGLPGGARAFPEREVSPIPLLAFFAQLALLQLYGLRLIIESNALEGIWQVPCEEAR